MPRAITAVGVTPGKDARHAGGVSRGLAGADYFFDADVLGTTSLAII